MSAAAKSAAWGTVTALVVLVAANGVAFFDSLRAGWVFVTEITSGMPLGLGSFLLAWLLGVCLMGFLRRWIPEPKRLERRQDLMHWRMFLIEVSSAAAAFAVVWLQTRTLLGMILGLTAGLSISIIYRVLAAAGSALMRFVYVPPKEEK